MSALQPLDKLTLTKILTKFSCINAKLNSYILLRRKRNAVIIEDGDGVHGLIFMFTEEHKRTEIHYELSVSTFSR